jgi:hypothetical protein
MCVQRFNDSRNSAIHITYRISLRSSSLREPRDPLSKVVSIAFAVRLLLDSSKKSAKAPQKHYNAQGLPSSKRTVFTNDPTAGSPTVTLLRLLLPLNDQV